jgi:chemotaxis methyl-accepting protein methylase
MSTGTIFENELSEVRLLIERQTGTVLDRPNSVLATHVANYLERQKLESTAPLLDRLRSSDQDPAILPQFLDGLLNTTTGFFRHPGALNAFARQVLPQLRARKSAEGGQVRVWSAGCATGEEAYSIAMAVCNAPLLDNAAAANVFSASKSTKEGRDNNKDKYNARNGGIAEAAASPTAVGAKDWAVQIIGSDLLPSAIQIAERGLYPQSALIGLPTAAIRACFSKIGAASRAKETGKLTLNGSASRQKSSNADLLKHDQSKNDLAKYEDSDPADDSLFDHPGQEAATPPNISPATHLLVKARLRSMVTFNVMNLVRPVYIGRFDCIFCMDVLPSLSRAQRTALLERLHLYLEPGGYLFLSQTEKLSAPNLNFRSETFDGYTFHRKPLAASAAYGR